MTRQESPPITEALTETARDPFTQKIKATSTLARAWVQWFLGLKATLDKTTKVIGALRLLTQGASIASTPVTLPALSAGLYRVTIYARITRPATTSSSLTTAIGWTEGAVVLSSTGAALVGNTTGTFEARSITIRIDQASPITYSTTYASVGGTSMQYALDVVVEEVPVS